MLTTIELPPVTVREVVLTCVVLHNILRSQYQGQHGGQEPGDDDKPLLQKPRTEGLPQGLLQ